MPTTPSRDEQLQDDERSPEMTDADREIDIEALTDAVERLLRQDLALARERLGPSRGIDRL